MSKTNKVLTVAYDSGDDDISCLVVARKEYDKFRVLSVFHGTEADKLYHNLLNTEGKQ